MQSATEFKAFEIYPDGVYLIGALWRISNQGLNFLFFFFHLPVRQPANRTVIWLIREGDVRCWIYLILVTSWAWFSCINSSILHQLVPSVSHLHQENKHNNILALIKIMQDKLSLNQSSKREVIVNSHTFPNLGCHQEDYWRGWYVGMLQLFWKMFEKCLEIRAF